MLSTGYDSIEGLGLSHFGGLGSTSPADRRLGAPLAQDDNASSFYVTTDVIDPSDGANYSGGSSFAPGMPLGPSSWGLAGLPTNRGHVGDLMSCLGRHGLCSLDSELVTFGPQEDLGLLPLPPQATKPKKQVRGSSMVDYVTSDLGDLMDTGALKSADGDMRTVMAAALQPGTAAAGAVAKALVKKSLILGQQAAQRGGATEVARKNAAELAAKVDEMEGQVKAAAAKIFVKDASGTAAINPDANPSDVQHFKNLREKQLLLARRAVRFQKVNAVGTAMTENAAAQAAIAQQIAASVLAGQPNAVAALGAIYQKLGQSSAELRNIRQAQVRNSTAQHDVDTLNALLRRKTNLMNEATRIEVQMSRCDTSSEAASLRSQYENIAKMKREVDAELAALCRKAPAMGTPVGLDGLEAPLDELDAELRGFFSNPFKAVSKAVGGAAKAVGKVVVPIKSVRKAMTKAFNSVAKVATKVFVDLPCKLATSGVGRAAMNVAGPAIGVALAGPAAGPTAGQIAAGRAASVSKIACGGLKQLGLRDGKFRTSQLGKVLVKTGTALVKEAADPKKFLADAKLAGSAFMSAGGGSSILSQFGGGTIGKLGLSNIASRFGMQAAANGAPNALSFLQNAGGPMGQQILRQIAGTQGGTASLLNNVAPLIAQGGAGGRLDVSALVQRAAPRLMQQMQSRGQVSAPQVPEWMQQASLLAAGAAGGDFRF